jgi:hypothetical protein
MSQNGLCVRDRNQKAILYPRSEMPILNVPSSSPLFLVEEEGLLPILID